MDKEETRANGRALTPAASPVRDALWQVYVRARARARGERSRRT